MLQNVTFGASNKGAIMITKEVVTEVAEVRFGENEYDEKDLKKIENALRVRVAHNHKNLFMQEDEAKEKAIEDLKVPLATKKKGDRGKIIKFTKEAFLHFWSQGKTTASAYEVTMWAVSEEKYHTESPKGVGDTMGRGKGSLFLEASSEKMNGKKALIIPDPDKFSDWYEHNIPLPEEYYSDSIWKELNAADGLDGGSHFLERFL